VSVSTGATVRELKEKLSPACNVAADKLKLVFRAGVLDDPSLLTSYEIKDGAVVYIVARMMDEDARRGKAKARKSG